MDSFKDFIVKYRGSIIGGILAIVALILNIHKILFGALIVVAGILAGNYVQRNKDKVKDKIREVVDRW